MRGKGQDKDTGITSVKCPACGANVMKSNATGEIVAHFKQGSTTKEMCYG